jgi:hypothetical protein
MPLWFTVLLNPRSDGVLPEIQAPNLLERCCQIEELDSAATLAATARLA